MSEARRKLKAMLQWSDRLGSDEIAEIQEVVELIKLLEP